jgi:hypothetical protein
LSNITASQADSAFQSNSFGSCQVFGDPCFSGKVTSVLSCSSSDKVTPVHPTCALCTNAGHVWLSAVSSNATQTSPRPDVGQCFLGGSDDLPMTCPDCLNPAKWRQIKLASQCSGYRGPSAPSVFANPSTTCLQVTFCMFVNQHTRTF